VLFTFHQHIITVSCMDKVYYSSFHLAEFFSLDGNTFH